MKRIKSNLEKANELAMLITEKTKYKAHVAYINALCLAQGYTITIKEGWFKLIQIVYDNGDLDYYTRSKSIKELTNFEKQGKCQDILPCGDTKFTGLTSHTVLDSPVERITSPTRKIVSPTIA